MAETLQELRDLLNQARWDAAVELLRHCKPKEAADAILAVPFERQRSLFRRLPADLAAVLIAYFPYFHTYVLLHSLTTPQIAAIVGAMSPTEREGFLEELPEESWQSLMKTLEEEGLKPPSAPRVG